MVNLLFDELALTIAPSSKELEDVVLTYTEKKVEMVQRPGQPFPTKQITREKVKAFTVLSDAKGVRIIQTYHGLLQNVVDFLHGKGLETRLMDNRPVFPKPDLTKMFGFRFSQRALLVEALMKNKSGLVCAPTRYGKTTMLINTLRAYPGIRTVVTVPGKDLVRQLYADVKEKLPLRNVVLLGAGSSKKFPSEDVTVCSMDSLHHADPGAVKLLLIDEPHTAVTDSRKEMIAQFDNARKIGFGATVTGRFDGRDILVTGLIGSVLAERTYREAVEEGAICPLVVYMLRVRFEPFRSFSRDAAYKSLLFQSKGMADLAASICHNVLPPDWQNICFIKDEKQADLYLEAMGQEGSICMAKTMTESERKTMFALMVGDGIKRCIASSIFAMGVTFSNVRAIINCAAGGNNTTAIQKPGRLAEIRPGKGAGYMFDFLFQCEEPATQGRRDQEWRSVERDSLARLTAYTDKGYEVHIVETEAELLEKFNKREGL